MSTHCRTYRVTRLKIIALLSTSLNREHEKYLPEIFEIVQREKMEMFHIVMGCTLGFIRVGGSHISMTWLHTKWPHLAYMARKWIVHMAYVCVGFYERMSGAKWRVSGGVSGHQGASPLPWGAGHMGEGAPWPLSSPLPFGLPLMPI